MADGATESIESSKLMNVDFWKLFWNALGWTGQLVFFSRFFVQWYATEKKKQVVIPSAFWWLSIAGSLLLLLYAVFYDKHYVVIFSYAFTWIPYIRNLIIHYRHKEAHSDCPHCGTSCPPQSKFCSECGARLALPTEKTVLPQ
jgi:lipid-A-disaccharide synthase-like uncharacterized protein